MKKKRSDRRHSREGEAKRKRGKEEESGLVEKQALGRMMITIALLLCPVHQRLHQYVNCGSVIGRRLPMKKTLTRNLTDMARVN